MQSFPPRSCQSARHLLAAMFVMAAVLNLAEVTRAQNRLASIFQDNMILQREKPVPVWGWAEAGAKVQVSFGEQSKEVVADASGYWKAALDPLPASKVGRNLDVRAGQTVITRKDVQVGEVWITAGQSNMCTRGKDLDAGVYPRFVSPAKPAKGDIRICDFGAGYFRDPQADVPTPSRGGGAWVQLKENPWPDAMNIPEYAARIIRDGLDVPVGIIHVAVPGTNQAAWMSRPTLEKFPGKDAGKDGPDFYKELFAEHEAKLPQAAEKFQTWKDYETAQAAWLAQNKTEMRVKAYLSYANFPSVLYNTRIHPLAPMAIRGVMWHQGEAGPGGAYDARLVAMVHQWRELFGQDFYFVFGTLARNTATAPPLLPARTGFYRSITNTPIRRALELFGPKGNAALVELYDTGNNVTHWDNKAEAGRRFGLAALTEAYGQKHTYTGPRMVETSIDKNKATIRFAHVGDGLTYEPSINGISGVYVSGKTGKPQWAQVKVVAMDTIEVSHPDVAEINTIAYADSPNPHETLFSSDRLPASPFVVNPTQVKDDPGVPLITAADSAKAELHIAHVRRAGYMFSLGGEKAAAGNVKMQAYIPAEWNGYEVVIGGRPVTAAEAKKDGNTIVTFNAPTGAGWILVAEKGKAADFLKVNRF